LGSCVLTPSAILPNKANTSLSVPSLTNRTDPSPRPNCAPPEWALPGEAKWPLFKSLLLYRMPVLNDYLAGAGLYQIRIGFFESRENARTFQQQMKREYPSEYGDSWIVQLKW